MPLFRVTLENSSAVGNQAVQKQHYGNTYLDKTHQCGFSHVQIWSAVWHTCFSESIRNKHCLNQQSITKKPLDTLNGETLTLSSLPSSVHWLIHPLQGPQDHCTQNWPPVGPSLPQESTSLSCVPHSLPLLHLTLTTPEPWRVYLSSGFQADSYLGDQDLPVKNPSPSFSLPPCFFLLISEKDASLLCSLHLSAFLTSSYPSTMV